VQCRGAAQHHAVPAQAAAELYERLVEASIAYEFVQFDALRSPAK
jgi:hypothetical protein